MKNALFFNVRKGRKTPQMRPSRKCVLLPRKTPQNPLGFAWWRVNA